MINVFILYSPQFNEQDELTYQFEGDKIIATLNGKTDEFDFTGMPDGSVDNSSRDGDNIITKLSICPIVSAKKEDGVLFVELLKFIKMDATEEERFPKWIEVGVNGDNQVE